jgi:hypothetical protein
MRKIYQIIQVNGDEYDHYETPLDCFETRQQAENNVLFLKEFLDRKSPTQEDVDTFLKTRKALEESCDGGFNNPYISFFIRELNLYNN